MKWRVRVAPPQRNERNWYPYFPLFFPVRIDNHFYWLVWIEERYTGQLTGHDGEKIYEYRERQLDTPPNGPVHAISPGNWLTFALIGLFIFVIVWNHYH